MFAWRSLFLWIVVLVITTGLTWQIVSAADSRISDPPLAAVTVSTVELVPSSTATASLETSTSFPGASTTTTQASTSTLGQPSSSTPTTTPGSPTTSSTSVTTPTSASAQWSVKTIDSAGGSISVRYRPAEVELVTATPATGFVTEIDEAGPPRVRVEFRRQDSEFEIRVEWKNGELEIQIEES